MEQPPVIRRKRRRWGRIILLLIAVSTAAYYGSRRWMGPRTITAAVLSKAGPVVPDVRAPEGVRIKVEVINATATRGLARRATLFLRDRGFDVVYTGTTRTLRDTTLVLDRSSHPEWAGLVGRALSARVESRPESSRYLDVTVLIGTNWRPPALPLYP